jgi:antitoxin MazE
LIRLTAKLRRAAENDTQNISLKRRYPVQVQLSKWGNSLGLRLPRALAAQIGAREGQKVSVVADGGRLIIEPAAETWRLEDLLVGMTPEAMGEAFDWGDDAGREAVDD